VRAHVRVQIFAQARFKATEKEKRERDDCGREDEDDESVSPIRVTYGHAILDVRIADERLHVLLPPNVRLGEIETAASPEW